MSPLLALAAQLTTAGESRLEFSVIQCNFLSRTGSRTSPWSSR